MQEGRASQTAVMVCLARALAHVEATVPGFSDPTALPLLPDEARARFERLRSPPQGAASGRERMQRKFLEGRAHMMAIRTVAIDQAVRMTAAPQVVILGAGLDGRAWRMPELRDTVVFEVDHPDTQREKMARAASLPPVARDVRFVPVDFTRDRLDERLAAAGHDPARRTTWIWEGVVMYLTRAEVEATLQVVADRSAAGSRLAIAYAAPGLILPLVRLIVRRIGEPFRSVFTARAMKTLLAAHHFAVVTDDDIPTLARPLSTVAWRATRTLKHIRVVVAELSRPAPPTD
ncbi:MAG: class I SAM-dependent methyltransferase [Myxococcales bacterium]